MNPKDFDRLLQRLAAEAQSSSAAALARLRDWRPWKEASNPVEIASVGLSASFSSADGVDAQLPRFEIPDGPMKALQGTWLELGPDHYLLDVSWAAPEDANQLVYFSFVPQDDAVTSPAGRIPWACFVMLLPALHGFMRGVALFPSAPLPGSRATVRRVDASLFAESAGELLQSWQAATHVSRPQNVAAWGDWASECLRLPRERSDSPDTTPSLSQELLDQHLRQLAGADQNIAVSAAVALGQFGPAAARPLILDALSAAATGQGALADAAAVALERLLPLAPLEPDMRNVLELISAHQEDAAHGR